MPDVTASVVYFEKPGKRNTERTLEIARARADELSIRTILVASGPAALREDRAAQEHLVECTECFAFLEALAELERAFAAMPAIDAPDEAVESLLSSPELTSKSYLQCVHLQEGKNWMLTM